MDNNCSNKDCVFIIDDDDVLKNTQIDTRIVKHIKEKNKYIKTLKSGQLLYENK